MKVLGSKVGPSSGKALAKLALPIKLAMMTRSHIFPVLISALYDGFFHVEQQPQLPMDVCSGMRGVEIAVECI